MTNSVHYSGSINSAARIFVLSCVGLALTHLINNYLIFWRGWPGPLQFILSQFRDGPSLKSDLLSLGGLQLVLLAFLLLGIVIYVKNTPHKSLLLESDQLSRLAAYLCRGSFWAVFLIGFIDMGISFLRVEDWLSPALGKELALELGRSNFRGIYVHYPLILIGFIIAFRHKGLGFIWLAFLIVIAEFLIVVSRFVFSYEQAFMGDLVRMWYAALFLFASANALVTEGHVRVDVFYANMRPQRKALANALGSVLLGMPLCWIILLIGMWDKGSSINSPLRSFEIYQQGFGMYIKYLMVGFLIVFALTMLIQFCSYFLENLSLLLGEEKEERQTSESTTSSPA